MLPARGHWILPGFSPLPDSPLWANAGAAGIHQGKNTAILLGRLRLGSLNRLFNSGRSRLSHCPRRPRCFAAQSPCFYSVRRCHF